MKQYQPFTSAAEPGPNLPEHRSTRLDLRQHCPMNRSGNGIPGSHSPGRRDQPTTPGGNGEGNANQQQGSAIFYIHKLCNCH